MQRCSFEGMLNDDVFDLENQVDMAISDSAQSFEIYLFVAFLSHFTLLVIFLVRACKAWFAPSVNMRF